MTRDDIVRRALATGRPGGAWTLRLPHRDRISPAGIIDETRVLWSNIRDPKPVVVREKFLIVSRARSGSTLLTRLLNAHPEVRCDRERLARRTIAPIAHLDRLARRSKRPVWGAKLLSYQMIRTMRLKDPAEFLAKVADHGFRLIHLQRDTFTEALSATMALKRKHYHNYTDPSRGGGGKSFEGPVTLDPEQFRRMLTWSEIQLEYERHALAGLGAIPVSYEKDLGDLERQQKTAARLFETFGVPPLTVKPDIRKVLPSDPRRTVANYDEVLDHIDRQGLGHLVGPEFR